MSIAVSAIETLIGSYPTSLFTAHKWYINHPTDTDAAFPGTGYFSGGDLPFGVIYELHDTPAGLRFDWRDSIRFIRPLAHIVNNARVAGGYSSSLPVEEFLIDRPAGILLFHEPATTSIVLECLEGTFLELWGLYIDVPLITPAQPAFTVTSTGATDFTRTIDGTAYTALTGSGSVAINDLAIGARVDVTVLPDPLGREAGSPEVLFDVGWINWGDINAVRTRERITAENWSSFPTAVLAGDVLHYSLHDGVEATITELLPNVS